MSERSTSSFVWIDQVGRRWPVDKMTTLHLFHSLRMLWNHTMPEGQRFEPFREWPDVREWSTDCRRAAAEAFVAELEIREDREEKLTAQQRSQWDDMRKGMWAFRRELKRHAKLPGSREFDDPRWWDGDTPSIHRGAAPIVESITP